MKKYLILLASGTGTRFGADCPKQFIKIGGKMIIEHTMASCDCGIFDEIILVVSAPYVDQMKQVVLANKYKAPVRVVEGGNSRIESCGRGVAIIGDEDAIVIVHNGVQPFVGRKSFDNCIAALGKYSAVTCGVKCVYTVLETSADGVLVNTPDRSKMYSDMGPEGFRLNMLRKVVDIGIKDIVSTGLCGVVFRNSLSKVYVADGEPGNIKITFPEDIALAEQIINNKRIADNEQ